MSSTNKNLSHTDGIFRRSMDFLLVFQSLSRTSAFPFKAPSHRGERRHAAGKKIFRPVHSETSEIALHLRWERALKEPSGLSLTAAYPMVALACAVDRRAYQTAECSRVLPPDLNRGKTKDFWRLSIVLRATRARRHAQALVRMSFIGWNELLPKIPDSFNSLWFSKRTVSEKEHKNSLAVVHRWTSFVHVTTAREGIACPS
ncbi:hypothetical protein CEXT_697741 [Caerostris extrusa]|uniref:Uncharacterized protein n=1 Tax=Caerostris extrusa TaxID=172846 RepID=A0AAV4QQR9_CAEEX|nr:hypothetical protein CEXT_697741 [Caerostris extrusa]